MKPQLALDVDTLPFVRGGYRYDYAIAKTTWFQVGGPCAVLFRPQDQDDLRYFLQHRPQDVDYTVIGLASNMLIRDGGIPGVTIRLGKAFNHIAFSSGYVDVGASVIDRNLAMIAAQQGYTGFEFLASIPGGMGGALRMNAGCYGSEIKDILDVAFAVDGQGKPHQLTCDDMGFGYRQCNIPDDWIFTGARFKTRVGKPEVIAQCMNDMLAQRELTQPVKSRTGGSTFANPDTHKAWQLIDQAGCRALAVNDAQMSPLHCNFMINNGQATAHDLESLGEMVRRKVFDCSGVKLKWEIKRIGNLLNNQKIVSLK